MTENLLKNFHRKKSWYRILLSVYIQRLSGTFIASGKSLTESGCGSVLKNNKVVFLFNRAVYNQRPSIKCWLKKPCLLEVGDLRSFWKNDHDDECADARVKEDATCVWKVSMELRSIT